MFELALKSIHFETSALELPITFEGRQRLSSYDMDSTLTLSGNCFEGNSPSTSRISHVVHLLLFLQRRSTMRTYNYLWSRSIFIGCSLCHMVDILKNVSTIFFLCLNLYMFFSGRFQIFSRLDGWLGFCNYIFMKIQKA